MPPFVLPPAVEHARLFAVDAHADQRYGEHPYVVHLDEVVGVLHEHLEPPAHDLWIIGYLHDVVEDTSITLPEIISTFGEGIARCVDLLTDAPGDNRKERKAATYARLAEVQPHSPDARALVVKAADRLANARRCVLDQRQRLLQMYQREHPTFRASALRPGLALSIWEELDSLLSAS